MKIELLVFDGCPNSEPTEKLIRETMSELGGDVKIEVVTVADNDDAVAKRFLGSPSVRVNGKDLEIEENETTQYSMRCRLYRTDESQSGLPPKELLTKAIQAAQKRSES
ncbi:MAG: thioredoxin family protein [candidate division Zixibacteria bacterium]|nr:thioredoxin family protein [candidate division Zixibacteria bacterium]